MQTELVGYLLNALEEEEVRAVEEMLAVDEAARRQLDLLRFALLPLGRDTQHEEPPSGLAVRTCKALRQIRATKSSGLD